MSEPKQRINVEDDFSRYPLGRDDNDGPFNGEKFRREHLVPSLNAFEKVTVFLDGPKGYGSSFLEEAFGGLVRKENFSSDELKSKLEIIFEQPVYQIYYDEAWEYINEA